GQDATDHTDDQGGQRCEGTRGRGDGDQAGHHAGGGAQGGGVPVAQPFGGQPAEHGGRGGGGGVQPGHTGQPIGGEGGATVEPEPSEPQQCGTEHDQREVVGPRCHRREGAAGADDQREHQRRGTCGDV